MAGCPACGGADREPIAPNYWLCTSEVQYEDWVVGPTPGAPPHLGHMSPQPVVRSRVCNTRYHEVAGPQASGGLPLCYCETTFAIGLCGACRRPVCGDHSALRDARRLCLEDTKRFDEAESQKAQGRQEVQRLDGRLEHFARLITELRMLPDADTRFAVALHKHWLALKPTGEGLSAGRLGDFDRRFALVEAEYLPLFEGNRCFAFHPDPRTWQLDEIQLVSWFAERHPQGRRTVRLQEQVSGLFGPRDRTASTEDAWFLETQSAGGDHYGRGSYSFSVLVLADGRKVRVLGKNNKVGPWSATKVGLGDLKAMFRVLNLQVQ